MDLMLKCCKERNILCFLHFTPINLFFPIVDNRFCKIAGSYGLACCHSSIEYDIHGLLFFSFTEIVSFSEFLFQKYYDTISPIFSF